jgi:DNA-binding MarR family transcriptional regulator
MTTVLAPGKKRAAEVLLRALEPLSNLRGSRSIPLPFAVVFLTVVLDEGKGNNEYARALGIDRRIMSRYFLALGKKARNGGPGLGLIEVKPLPDDNQKVQIFLTAKGRLIADKVLDQITK